MSISVRPRALSQKGSVRRRLRGQKGKGEGQSKMDSKGDDERDRVQEYKQATSNDKD